MPSSSHTRHRFTRALFSLTFCLSTLGWLTPALAQAPSNDDCGNAIEVSVPSLTPGTTIGAGLDSVPDCAVAVTDGGVWYVVSGTGGVIRASVCQADFDSKITVLSGDCSQLVCEGAADDNCQACPLSIGATFSWTSDSGIDYLILIHGFMGTGNFTLNVEDLPPAPNDECINAIPVGVPSMTPGRTVGASADPAPACNDPTAGPVRITDEGVWYTLSGTGGVITASLCDATFDSKITVYTGSCSTLDCVGAGDDNCGSCPDELGASFTWSSEMGNDYLVLVHGFMGSGDFTLNVTEEFVPSNDECVDAIPVVVPSINPGTTVAASIDSFPICRDPTCRPAEITDPGVWYFVQGTGSEITVSVCDATFDSKVSVYSGTCADPSCVGAGDDQCGPNNLGAELSWCSVPGLEYSILVHGFSQGMEGTGSFILEIDGGEACVPSTASCEFIRGDANGDGNFNGLVDGLFLLRSGFVLGHPRPPCLAAADVDADLQITPLVDAVFALSFEFVPGAPEIPAPFPNCGSDQMGIGALSCEQDTCP